VLQQTYTDFELIVVDDGSTDSGADKVLRFTDPRVRLVRQMNGGASSARNRGSAEGKGACIAFLDADDEWDFGFLEAVMNLAKLYPQAGVYGTGYRMVYPKGPVVEVTAEEACDGRESLLVTDYFVRANGGSLINASGVMIPRRVFNDVGPFSAGDQHGEDLEMWSRIALRYPIGYDTRILFSFHQTGVLNKPRFNQLPRYEPHVQMLKSVLAGSVSSLHETKDIRAHISDRYMKVCMWFISNSTRAATAVFVDQNEVRMWRPFLAKLIDLQFLWPFLRFAAWVRAITSSRLVLRVLGSRASYGVLTRLGSSRTP
jgi:glycosyltransferase involved in cell wall biosynthesis